VTQPARVFELWRRLYKRFLIEPFPAEGGGTQVSTTIQPTTNADELLRNPTGDSVNLDLTGSAGGTVVAYVVPAGERWTIKHLFREDTAASSQIYLFTGGFTIFFTKLGTDLEPADGLNIRLNAEDQIGMTATGNAGDGAIFLMLVVEKEDSFT